LIDSLIRVDKGCADCIMQATDVDTGVYGQITYSILSGNAS